MDNDNDAHADAEMRVLPPMSDTHLALLRQRVASRYYDHPQVVDTVARRLMRARDDLDESPS